MHFLYFVSSWNARIGVSFLNKTYYDVAFHCYSDRFEEDKLYQVYCNATNDEIRLKIPQEGTMRCIQVSYLSKPLQI